MVRGIALVIGGFVGGAGIGAAQDPAPARIAEPQEAVRTKEKETPAYVEMYDIRDLALPAAARRLALASPPEVDRGDENHHHFVGVNPSALDLFFAKRSEHGAGDPSDVAAWNLVETLIRRVCLRDGHDVESCRVMATGALVVKATREQHATIDKLLQELRRSVDGVPVEVRILELDETAQQRLASLAAAKSVAGSPALTQALTPTASELEDLLADPGTTVLVVPKVFVLQLDEFEIEMVDQFSYIANFELTAIEGMGTIADPIIKTVKQGTSVHGRCVAAAALPGETATPYALRIEVEVAEVKRPIATQKTDLGTIQLPEVKRASIASTVAGTTGRSILIGGVPRPSFDEKAPPKKIWVLATVGTPRQEH